MKNKKCFMAEKYFQYLKGENRGNVVKLKEIDDTMPDMILYVFDDGFRCNEEFIAPLNEWDVLNKIMAEVESPTNVWKFQEKILTPENKEAFAKDGQAYEAPDPYFVGKNGEELSKSKKEIILTHPRRTPFPPKAEELNEFYISYKEKLKNQEVAPTETSKAEEEIKDVSEAINNALFFGDVERVVHIPERMKFNVENQSEVISVTGECIFDFLKSLQLSQNDFVKALSNESFENKATALYKSCIKKPATVLLKVSLELPTPQLFKTIKENYPGDIHEKFIDNIINDIDIDELKEQLKNGLFEIYNKGIGNE